VVADAVIVEPVSTREFPANREKNREFSVLWRKRHKPSERSNPKFLGMAETHVISALRAKRAEISAYIQGLEKKVENWRARLAHIDEAIRIFSPETDPTAIPPKRTYRRSGYFKRSELARLCSDELRKANGNPITVAAITGNILDAKSMPRDPDLMASVGDRVQGLLRERMKRGLVIRTGKTRYAQWALAPSLL
jgi:hypothetical protein